VRQGKTPDFARVSYFCHPNCFVDSKEKSLPTSIEIPKNVMNVESIPGQSFMANALFAKL
jgi:hypothetical protein